MSLKLVLFDVDGTLVDSRRIILAAVERTARDLGRPVPADDLILSSVGLSLHPLMRRIFAEQADEVFIEAAVERYKRAFQTLRADPDHHEPAFPGAQATIAALHAREDVVLGIVTGKSRRGIAHILDRFGWQDRFATIQTADDAPSKPSPAMVLQAMAETRIEAGRVVVIGDTSFDMEMAQAARARGIGVSWGNHPTSSLRKAGATAIIDAFEDLETVLRGFWQDDEQRQ